MIRLLGDVDITWAARKEAPKAETDALSNLSGVEVVTIALQQANAEGVTQEDDPRHEHLGGLSPEAKVV